MVNLSSCPVYAGRCLCGRIHQRSEGNDTANVLYPTALRYHLSGVCYRFDIAKLHKMTVEGKLDKVVLFDWFIIALDAQELA